MAGFEGEGERAWDEYDWERFLQQQDSKTEKYMELLERYLDDPRRDEIIAREMGWTHLQNVEDWSAEVDALMEEEDDVDLEEEGEIEPETAESQFESFENHALYRAAFGLTIWIDELFDRESALQNEPAAVKLATQSALASAKLAAALSDHDPDEIGMTIAYLKRALKAMSTALDAAAELVMKKEINAEQYSVLQQRLFQVRDGIITLMGEYRGEWRRRYGSR
jgi:hypothetical protein